MNIIFYLVLNKKLILTIIVAFILCNLYGQNSKSNYIIPASIYDYKTKLKNLKDYHIVDFYDLKLDSFGIDSSASDFMDTLIKYLCDSTGFETNEYQLNLYFAGDSNSYVQKGFALQNAVLSIQMKYLYHSKKPKRWDNIIVVNYLFQSRNDFIGDRNIRVGVLPPCTNLGRDNSALWKP